VDKGLTMQICETSRLMIRHINTDDAEFMLKILNDPSFIENIGDKQVRTVDEAIKHIQEGSLKSYKTHGFGLNIVILKHTNQAIGLCGLLKREQLSAPDLGYALLPEFWSKGYAKDAALAILEDAKITFHLERILATTSANNKGSNHLLRRLGFEFKKTINLYADDDYLFEYTFG
jgi:RimJ/RimL family protein N-acetyltransferase